VIDVRSVILEARRLYRLSGTRLNLPTREHVSSPSDIRPNSLGLCALKAAYEKAGTPSDYPNAPEDDTTFWIMEHGNYVAPMIQEPLMHYAMVSEVAFVPEAPVKANVLGYNISGRADGLLSADGQSCVIEIKDTEGKAARSVGEPQLRYVWQTLVYMLALSIPQGAIITVGKWGWHVWDIVPRDHGYIVLDKDGNPYRPLYGDQWNNPGRINVQALRGLLNEHDAYMKAVHSVSGYPIPPIDPLNGDMRWLCVHHWELPKITKGEMVEGRLSPSCPFAKRCHGFEDRNYATIKNPITNDIVLKEQQ